jgi:hypothetical protein
MKKKNGAHCLDSLLCTTANVCIEHTLWMPTMGKTIQSLPVKIV